LLTVLERLAEKSNVRYDDLDHLDREIVNRTLAAMEDCEWVESVQGRDRWLPGQMFEELREHAQNAGRVAKSSRVQ